jgi:preprotein translocase subunit SecG
MEHGTTLLAILHILVALLLITIVLLQDSKGGGMGGAFGGGGSQTLFGATGAANFLVKLTRTLAVIFMGTCIGLTLLLTRTSSHSVVDSLPAAAQTSGLPDSKVGQPNNPSAPPAPQKPGDVVNSTVVPPTTGHPTTTAPPASSPTSH